MCQLESPSWKKIEQRLRFRKYIVPKKRIDKKMFHFSYTSLLTLSLRNAASVPSKEQLYEYVLTYRLKYEKKKKTINNSLSLLFIKLS